MSKLGELEERVREADRVRRLTEAAAPGDVFIVDDAEVHFQDNLDREPHETRRVIIVQGRAYCAAPRPNTVIIVPCTTSAKYPTAEYEYEIRGGSEKSFTAERVVVQPHLPMAIPKSALRVRVGTISDEALEEIRVRLMRLLDLADAI